MKPTAAKPTAAKLTAAKLTAANLARKFAPICLALAVVLALAGTASACPGCKNALLNDTEGGGNLVAGYFWSILFMMSMPFLLVASFGGSMYLSVRRARAQQAAQAEQTAIAEKAASDAAPAKEELIEA